MDGGSTHCLIPAADHGTHAEAHSFVRVNQIAEVLASGGDGNTLLVPELVETALNTKVCFPVLAVGSTTSHGTEEVWVDLNHLLDGARGNVGAGGCSRVDSYDNATLEAEGKRCGTVLDLDLGSRVG